MRRGKAVVDLPAGVFRVRAKGKEYFYFQPGRGSRNPGPRQRLPGDPHDPAFWAAIKKLAGEEGPRTFTALIGCYKASPEFASLADATRRDYSRYLDITAKVYGELDPAQMTPSAAIDLRDMYADRPSSANHLVNVLQALFAWGVVRGWADQNPCREVKPLPVNSRGKNPWPQLAFRLVEKYAREDVRRAVWLGGRTGQRPSDVIKMTPQHFDGAGIQVTQNKTGKKLWIPLSAEDAATLKSWGGSPFLPYVMGPTGEPYDMQRFQQVWQRFVNLNRATLLVRKHKLSLHGLRATACVRLRIAGLDASDIADIVGMSEQMVRTYTREVSQKEFAKAAVLRLKPVLQ